MLFPHFQGQRQGTLGTQPKAAWVFLDKFTHKKEFLDLNFEHSYGFGHAWNSLQHEHCKMSSMFKPVHLAYRQGNK